MVEKIDHLKLLSIYHWAQILQQESVHMMFKMEDGLIIKKPSYTYQNARGYTIDNFTAPYDVAKMIIMIQEKRVQELEFLLILKM